MKRWGVLLGDRYSMPNNEKLKEYFPDSLLVDGDNVRVFNNTNKSSGIFVHYMIESLRHVYGSRGEHAPPSFISEEMEIKHFRDAMYGTDHPAHKKLVRMIKLGQILKKDAEGKDIQTEE